MRKFQDEGELRVTITYQNWRLIEAADGRTVKVPEVIILGYPMDPSYIALRLRHIRVNEVIKEEVFQLGL